MKKQIYIPAVALISLLISIKVIAATIDTSPHPPTIFRDGTSDISFSIQLTPDRPDTGKFDFYVPSTGFYEGTIALLQSGKQIVHPQGTTTAQFYPLVGGVQPSIVVRMEGEIDIVRNNASVNIWVGNLKYHIKTAQPDATAGAVTAKQVLTSTVSQNWQTLYGLLSAQVQSTITPAQLEQLMETSPNIIAADLNGTGQISTVNGFAYFSQPVTLTVQNSDGTTSVFHSIEFFVLEQGVWHLLSTNTPTP